MHLSLLNHSLGYRCDAEYNIYNIAEKLQTLSDDNIISIKGQVRAQLRTHRWRRSV